MGDKPRVALLIVACIGMSSFYIVSLFICLFVCLGNEV